MTLPQISSTWPYLSTLTSYTLPYRQTHPDVDEGVDTGASVPVKLGPLRMLSRPLSRPTSCPLASLQIERPLTEALGTIQPPLQSQLYKDKKLKVTIHTGSVQCVVTRHRSLNSTHRKQDTYNLLNNVSYLSESRFSLVASFRMHHASFFRPKRLTLRKVTNIIIQHDRVQQQFPCCDTIFFFFRILRHFYVVSMFLMRRLHLTPVLRFLPDNSLFPTSCS